MSKISAPINMETVTEENISLYLDMVKKCGIERVFLIEGSLPYHRSSVFYRDPEKVRLCVREFKKVCSEVGFWFSTMGHGGALNFMGEKLDPRLYTPCAGVNGEISDHGYCVLDENFRRDLGEGVKKMAEFGPDIMMLDDDFRINRNHYYLGCFCPLHLKEFYKRIGEEVPREKLEALILQGGKNKYRSEYMRLMRDTMLGTAAYLREKVNEVDPKIRLSSSICQEMWDVNGFDVIELAKTFAGDTEPFVRIAGAPYWNNNIIPTVELCRTELKWLEDSGVETMLEGDTYPRPRYNVPSKPLELFDLLHLANGSNAGLLNYIFDYNQKPEYETGYVERFLRNQPLRRDTVKLFEGKKPVGVRVFQHHRLFENWDLPRRQVDKIFKKICGTGNASWSEMLSKNSIPTAFYGDLPLFVTGEHAKYISTEDLKNGAILDAQAAEILKNRGFDTGLIKFEKITPQSEFYLKDGDEIKNLSQICACALYCNEGAEILTTYRPNDLAASYFYKNAEGLQFLVFGFDHFASGASANYFCNYYRQAQIVESIEKMGKKLPAVSFKNPNLYILAAKSESSMAVAMANVSLDDIFSPEIALDKVYSEIKFINCSGRLEGDKVILSDITPYGFAAFEVK